MNMFKKIIFVRFCFASAYVLPEDLGLPTEKLICLYKECIEMAKHCNDISTRTNGCVQFATYSNSIGRYADSLRCLKEILPSAVVIPIYELLVHKYLSLTYRELEQYDSVVLHAKKMIEIAGNEGDKENEIGGNLLMGYAFLSLASYDDALDCFKKHLEYAQKTASVEDEMMIYKCIMFIRKGMQKHDDTILYARKFLDCAMRIDDKISMRTANLELGEAHLALNQYQDAIYFVKKCIKIAKEMEDKGGEVSACQLMGRIYRTLSDYDNAVIYYEKCIELAMTVGDKHAEARACSSLGEVYRSLGKYDDAISNCSKCIHIYKEDKASDASAYLTLGKVNQSLEKYDEAIQNFKQCIDTVNHIGKEKRAAAVACLFLGGIHATLGEYSDAIRYGKQCLNLSKETNATKIEMQVHYLLATIYLTLLQLNDASLSVDSGMAIATELGNKYVETKFEEIRFGVYAVVGLFTENNDEPLLKGLLELSTCSEDDLIEDLAQAVKTGDKIKKHRAYLSLSRFYDSKKDFEKTINCLEQLNEMDVDRSWSLLFFTKKGNLYQLMGQNDKALRCFKDGLSTAESCCDNMLRFIFYYGFGKFLYLSGEELKEAEGYLREAIRCFETVFTTLGSRDEFKISIFDQYIHSYKLMAALLINCKQIEEGLLVLDRCRARALKDLMMANFNMKQEGSDDEHLEYSDVLSLVSRNTFSISYYSFCFDTFLNFFLRGEANCLSYCPKYSLKTYVHTLFDEMGVIGEGVNCEDRSLDKEQDIQEEQKKGKEEYEALNQSTVSLLNVDSKGGESNENSAQTKGSTLEILFGVFECSRILSSKQDEVVIIPEGPLYQVPFPALRDPRTGKYLSQTKRIRLAPSLATLKHFENFPTDQTSNAEPLIVGSPLVGKVMMDGEELDIAPLFGALDEAIDIANILGVRPLVVADATKPAVLEKLQQGVSIVHIAAHGILSKAAIVLAPSPEIRATKIPEEEDYMLTMADVQQAQVRAQLVVLSCCHSGRGAITAEGVVGMCRAFLASGASAVVASLWAIDDDATLEFMLNFYLSLQGGKSASASLQKAMNEMRNSSNYSKPKYWAPFFLMGEDVTIKF